MTIRLTVVLCLLITITGICQDRTELDRRNGFKDIKLGMAIDSVKGAKLKKEFQERNEFPARLYEVAHEDYARIGEVKVNKIELKTYKDQIYEINVITNKDARLMRALESLYGRSDYDMKNETYFWKTDNLILKFKSDGKKTLQMLYVSYLVHQQMKADKNQKVDDIANDF